MRGARHERAAVHFNIGVAAYRSGDYPRAERAFREVAATPAMAALAHYNLGLVELKRGHERAARGWFEQAAQDGGDDRLRSLAFAPAAGTAARIDAARRLALCTHGLRL
jgi:TolA-binding protein